MELNEKELKEIICAADRHEKLCIMAILFSAPGKERYERPAGYTNGDFKRAIRHLRTTQRGNPDVAESYEPAITHIRNNWLRKAA